MLNEDRHPTHRLDNMVDNYIDMYILIPKGEKEAYGRIIVLC